MPHIIVNPYSTQCPSFADALWVPTINFLAQAQATTPNEVLAGLVDTWTNENQQLRNKWDTQVAADEAVKTDEVRS